MIDRDLIKFEQFDNFQYFKPAFVKSDCLDNKLSCNESVRV